MKFGKIFSNDIREFNGTQPQNNQIFTHNGTKNFWGNQNPSNVGVETIKLCDCTETQNPFDGAYLWVGIVIPQIRTTINNMKCWCTQLGTGTYKMGIYSQDFTKLAETNNLTTTSLGLQSGNLITPIELNNGEIYYFAIGGNINGASFLGSSLRFQSNPPFIAKEDGNLSTLPSVFSGGSSTQRRFWIGAFN